MDTDQAAISSGRRRVNDHPLQELMEAIESTHEGLGKLAVMSLVAAKAGQCLITVAPPGCGKSTVGDWLELVHPEAYKKQSVTRSSLKVYEKLFNGFTGCVIFDDVGAIDTEWSRVQTLVTMAEIVYGHFVSKDSHQLHIEIDDFFGSAILNIQPNVLKEVIAHPSWHANLADKSLRYYHLHRATKPNAAKLSAPADWGIDFNEVPPYDGDSPMWDAIMDIGLEQWTRPRALEHCQGLLRAVTALGSGAVPGELEMEVLINLMKPMTVEMEMIEKQGFGSQAILNDNLLYMLVEFATYGVCTYEQIAVDYHMKPTKVRDILRHMVDWFEQVGVNPVRLQASERLLELLKKAGIR